MHVAAAGLIIMNARLYDPWLGRFLSPDPYVQAPDFTQSLNRYSYCLNNPLKYTDESGEIIFTTAAIIGICVGAIIGTAVCRTFLVPGSSFFDINNYICK